jgi:hypothetical protein
LIPNILVLMEDGRFRNLCDDGLLPHQQYINCGKLVGKRLLLAIDVEQFVVKTST